MMTDLGDHVADPGDHDHPIRAITIRRFLQYIIRRKDGDATWAAIAGELAAAPIEFHPATRPLADLAAGFRSRYRLSLADAFAAALAKDMKAELVTGDPEFKALEKEIEIQWLR